MPTVRTTFRPDEDIEVTEREAAELRVQGLLVEDNRKAAAPKAKAADKNEENA